MRRLKSYLVEKFPKLVEYYSAYKEEWDGEPENEYTVFARIIKPYIQELFEESNDSELERIWSALEHIAREWGDPERNEIFVVATEEIELHKHYKHLGPTLMKQWIDSITWYPESNKNCGPINRHIDKKSYREKWSEEISSIGGFGSLTPSKENEIYRKLRSHFKIQSDVAT